MLEEMDLVLGAVSVEKRQGHIQKEERLLDHEVHSKRSEDYIDEKV